MKRSDLALIVLIVSITLVVSFLVVKAIFGEPQKQVVMVEKAEPIAAEVVTPSPKIFNKDAINPTIVIQIGNPANQQPFSGR